MPIKTTSNLVILASILIFGACNSGPKVIESQTNIAKTTTGGSSIIDWSKGSKSSGQVPASPVGSGSFSEDVHKVVVLETLMAQRYVYLKVQEGAKEFWIATNKQEVQVGAPYFYKGGLLKTNFHSKEHKRTFDQIYLVSKLVPEGHGHQTHAQPGPFQQGYQKVSTGSSGKATQASTPISHKKDDTRISDLVKNPKKYEGKNIQISGKVVKVNPHIMSRNWLHIKDGSADAYDLVVTTTQSVQEGSSISIEATVVLNKDFGAGYTYDLILENGTLIQ